VHLGVEWRGGAGSEQAELSRKVNKSACRSEVVHRQAVPRLRRAPWRGAMVEMLTLLCFAMALEKEIDIFPEQGGRTGRKHLLLHHHQAPGVPSPLPPTSLSRPAAHCY
jgi:hypothetical protein